MIKGFLASYNSNISNVTTILKGGGVKLIFTVNLVTPATKAKLCIPDVRKLTKFIKLTLQIHKLAFKPLL